MKSKSSPENVRHTLAHLLAAAVLEIHPDAKPAIGPAIENGFYYDFEFSVPISDKDLPKIETKMKEILPAWKKFSRKEINAAEVKELFSNNPYKMEIARALEENGETLTTYTAGEFTDLCRGGHAENPAEEIDPDAFQLDRVAGAYWQGSEDNPMLTRIYGIAFGNKKELDEFLLIREEAKKRDHKKLGKELGLFVFSDLVGSGLPLWTPKGTTMRNLLDEYVWELRKKKGYQKVTIPHLTKKDLYETSGHWAKFSEELFRVTTREDHMFALKPMNCPHHTQIFASSPKSYRDMPVRYCETTMVYRDEQSGELSGLSRVLSITQDDAHVFCRRNQIEQEFFAIWDIIDEFYETFGFKNMTVRLSSHDPEQFEKYLGDKDVWKDAEDQLKNLIEKRGIKDWIDGKGEAAMYGPKIDFMAKDAIGRTQQVATIQLDFNMPKNFDLTCVNEKGEKETVVMIHCAIMGSIERFMSVIIEHYAGSFPVWLSPIQIKILPIGENHFNFAQDVFSSLSAAGIRVELDDSNEGLGKKIRNAKLERIPYLAIVGDKEIEADMITLESRDGGSKQFGISELIEKISGESTERK